MTKPTFNLWTEPWIAIEKESGEVVTLGLADVLTQSHQYRALYDPSPLVTVGIHRLLVAILQDALNLQYEDELADVWEAGRFSAAEIAAFGEKYAHRFDLFSETEPFMQSADLPLYPDKKDKPNPKSAAVLFWEIPTGTGVTHYRHGEESDAQFCPADAAKGLIIIPPFASSGGAGIKPSINGVPPIYVIPGGKTLFDSLAASLTTPNYQPEISRGVPDTPWWKRRPIVEHKKEVRRVGYLYSLTFPARRVRLHPAPMTAPCIRCGQKHQWGVKTMVYQMGESRPKDAPFWSDPFAAYRMPGEKSKKGETPTPIRPVAGRALWREFAGLFLQSRDKRTRQPGVLGQIAGVADQIDTLDYGHTYPFKVVGLRTDMKAKIFEWTEAGFSVSPALLKDPAAGKLVQDAIEFAQNGEKIIKQVFRHSFGGSGKDARHKGVSATMAQAYWTKLAAPFNNQFIPALTTVDDWDEVFTNWLDDVVSAAETVFKTAAETLGNDGATLRQRVEGENYCRARLFKAKKEWLPDAQDNS